MSKNLVKWEGARRNTSEIITETKNTFRISEYSIQDGSTTSGEPVEGHHVFFVHKIGRRSLEYNAVFELCKNKTLSCQWVTQLAAEKLNPEASNIFVFYEFEGKAFKSLSAKLSSSGNFFFIIGYHCLRYIFERNELEVSCLVRPVLTLAMKGITVTFSGFRDKKALNEMELFVQRMNGHSSDTYTCATTHVITNTVISEKCSVAYAMKLPVMTADWVYAVWKESQTNVVHASDEQFSKMACPIFYKLQFCMSQISARTKPVLRKLIEDNGGTYSPDLIKKEVSVLLLHKPEGDKFCHSIQWGIPCVTPDWVHASMAAGHVVPFDEFRVEGSDHPLSSTPRDHAPVNIPDLTSCSVIPLTNAHVADSAMDSRFQFDSMMSDCNLNGKKKMKGNFLVGCKVYICGNGSHLAQAKQLLSYSGAAILDRLTVNTSHVIVLGTNIPKNESKVLNSFRRMPHIVGMEWLTESVAKNARADEELFEFEAEEESESSTTSQKSVSVIKASQVERSTSSTSSGFSQYSHQQSDAGESEGHRTCLSLAPDSKQELSQSQLLYQQAIESFDPNAALAPDGVYTPDASFTGDESLGPCTVLEEKRLFTGKSFNVLLEEDPNLAKLIKVIEDAGGQILINGSSKVDFIILPILHGQSDVERAPCFTELWIADCIHANTTDIPIELYHQPLLKFSKAENILEGVVLAISSYSLTERKHIIKVAEYLGAINQECFTRKRKGNILATTHLISPISDTEKYKAAMKWNIPVVKIEWIIACFKAQQKLNINSFLVTEESSIDESQSRSQLPETPKSWNRDFDSGRPRIVRGPQALTPNSISNVFQNEPHLPVMTGPKPGPEQIVSPLNKNASPILRRVTRGSESDEDAVATPNRLSGSDLTLLRRSNSVNHYVEAVPVPLNQPDVPEDRLSLGFSPNEVRRAMGICMLPSPETPKIVAKIWKEYCARFGARIKSPEENTKLQPIQEAKEVPLTFDKHNPQDFSDKPDIVIVRKIQHEVEQGWNELMNGTSDADEENQSHDKGQKRSCLSVSDDDSDEDIIVKSNKIGRKKRRSTELEKAHNVISEPQLELVRHSVPLNTPSLTGTLSEPVFVHSGDQKSIDTKDHSNSRVSASEFSSAFSGIESASNVQEHTETTFDEGASARMAVVSEVMSNTSKDTSKEESLMPGNVLDKVFVYVVRNLRSVGLQDTLSKLGATFVSGAKDSRLTHIIFQGKRNQMSSEIRAYDKVDSVQIVTPDWVTACDEQQIKVSEIDYAFDKFSDGATLNQTENASSAAVGIMPRQTRSSSVRISLENRDSPAEIQPNTSGRADAKANTNTSVRSNTSERWDHREGSVAQATSIVPKTLATMMGDSQIQTSRKALSAVLAEEEVPNSNIRETRRSKRASVVVKREKLEHVFLLTGFSGPEKVTMLKNIRSLGGRESSSGNYEEDVTMLISKVLTRTEKLLCSVAAGKPICHPAYVIDSLKEGKFLPVTEKYLWKPSDPKTEYEQEIATGFRNWFDKIGSNAAMKPFANLTILLLEKEVAKYESFKRLIIAGGGTVVTKADIQQANLWICDKKDIHKHFRDPTAIKIPHQEPAFLNNVLLKNHNLRTA